MYNRIMQLSPGTYNGVQLAAELQTQLNSGSLINSAGSYQDMVTLYDGRITAGRSYLFSKEWTDEPATFLRTKHVPYPGQGAKKALGYTTNPNLSDQYIHLGQALVIDFMDLQRHKQMFLCANIGVSSMQLLNSDTSCISRIPVNTQQGEIIMQHLSSDLSSATFTSEEVLQRIHFQLEGWD